jgi:hypothetical protein
MTRTINGRQLYNININHYRGTLLWSLQTWHTSVEDALAYGRKMAEYHHFAADEPGSVIQVSAELAA